MTTGYVVIAGGPEDRIERGEISVFRQVFASRNDAVAGIIKDLAEAIRDEDHFTVYRHVSDGLPKGVACDDLEMYYQIEEVEYP